MWDFLRVGHLIFGQTEPWRHLWLDSTGVYGISPVVYSRTKEFSLMNEARVSGWRNDLSVSTYSHLNQVLLGCFSTLSGAEVITVLDIVSLLACSFTA